MALNLDYLTGKKTRTESQKKQSEEEVEQIVSSVNSGGISFDVDDDYIQSFLNDSKDFSSSAQSDIKRAGYKSTSSIYGKVSSKASALREREGAIRAYLNVRKNSGGEYTEQDKQLSDYLDSFHRASGSSVMSLYRMRDYYNRFQTESDYNTAVRYSGYQQKYQGKDYDQIQTILSDLEDGEEKDWLIEYSKSSEVMTSDIYERLIGEKQTELDTLKKWKYNYDATWRDPDEPEDETYSQRSQRIKTLESELEELNAGKWRLDNETKYGSLSENEDYKKLSKEVSDDPTAGFGIQWGDKWFGFGDPTYDYINDIDGTREKLRYTGSGQADGDAALYSYSFMEPDEIANYNYLYNAEGKEAANKYLEYLKYELDARRQRQVSQNSAEFASEHPILSSIYSVPANLLSGAGLVDVAWQNAVKNYTEATTGEYAGPINYNSAAMSPNTISTSIRGTVSQNLADDYGTINLDTKEHPVLSRLLNGKSFGDVYQLGMSLSDTAAVAALSPIIGTAGTALLGGSAGTQGMLTAVEAGATDEQALAMGILNGAAEYIFERISLDHLLKGNTRSIVKAVLQQGFVEGTEELNTTLFNNIANILVMAEKSDYRSKIAAYMEQGLSEEEATKQALLDMAIQLGWDFAGGFISGGVMGGGATAVSRGADALSLNAAENANNLNVYGSKPTELIDEALELNPDNSLAQKMQSRVADGKDVSGRQVTRLVKQNEAAMLNQDVSAIQSAAAARLNELGETGDVDTIAAALAKQVSGKKLSKAEQQALSNSKYGQRVANELNVENIQPGEYSSAWAEQIGTEKINAEEYGRATPTSESDQSDAETAGGQIIAEAQETAQTVDSAPPETGSETSPLEAASEKYGAQAQAMVRTYISGQDVAKYDQAYKIAYDMGKSGVSLEYAMKSGAVSYLTEQQRAIAYETGAAAQNGYDASGDGKMILNSTGETISVQEISAIHDGKMTLMLTDGRTVDASEISFPSQNKAILYNAVATMDLDAADANKLISMYQNGNGISASDYSIGIQQAYRYGQKHYPAKELSSASYASKLSEEAAMTAYQAGQRAGERQTAREQASVARKEKPADRQGKVYFDKGSGQAMELRSYFKEHGKELKDVQDTAIQTMEKLSAALGIDFYVFESYQTEQGKRVYLDENGEERSAPNGRYYGNGKIYIDLNAGNAGTGTMLYTIAHELTHFIKQWSPVKFDVLASFLLEQYGNTNQSVEELVDLQIAKAQRNGRTMDFETAYEEMVADSMEAILIDGNVVQMMAELKQQDKTLWEKIRDWFRNLAEDLKTVIDAYKGVQPDSAEGKMVAQMQDVMETLEAFYADALVDASENYQAAETQKNTTAEGGEIRYSVRNGMLTAESTEAERYELLKDATVGLAQVDYDAIQDVNLEDYNTRKKSAVVPGFRALARQLGILNIDLQNSEIDFPFQFSRKNLEKSLHHQLEYGGSYQDYVKAMSCFNDLVRCAVPIEIHTDKKVGTLREKADLKQVYVLVSAYQDGEYVVPVEFEVKEYLGNDAKLYLSVVLTKIDLEVLDTGIPSIAGDVPHLFSKSIAEDEVVEAPGAEETVVPAPLFPSSTISLRQLFQNVNQQDGRFLKYVPDDFLNPAQKQAKQDALQRQSEEYANYGTPKFSARDYAEQVDEVKKNTHDPNNHVYMGTTPAGIVKVLDLPKLPMLITSQHVYSMAVSEQQAKVENRFRSRSNYHNLGWDTVKKLPEYINSPAMIIKSNTDKHDATFVVVTAQSDNTGNPIIAAVKPNGKGKYFDIELPTNIMLSGYGKDNLQRYVAKAKMENRILYVGRKNSQKMKNIPSVQFADNILSSDYTANLAEFKKIVKRQFAGTIFENSGLPKYSERDPDAARVTEVLEKENAKLKDDVSYLKELLKLQRRVTGGTKFTKTSVEAAAGQLMKTANAKGDRKELASLLNSLYEYIAGSDALTWESVAENAAPAVEWLQNHAVVKKRLNGYAQDILHQLRGSRVYLDDAQKQEAAYQYGSYNEFRKKTMGALVITDQATASLDSQWVEWSNAYPSIFDPETSANDMPATLLDAIDKLRSMTEVDAYRYDEKMASQDLLWQVYDSYWNVSTLRTVADVKQKEINALKYHHIKRMEQLREYHREKTAQLEEKRKADLQRVRAQYRERAEAKQRKIIEQYQESRKKGVENRGKTAMRNKIKRVVNELNQLLLNEDKKRHVPDNLKKAVAAALDLVSMDTVGADERVAKYAALIAKETDPDKIAAYQMTMENIQGQEYKMAKRLKELRDAYAEIAESDDPDIANAYDPVIEGNLNELASTIGDTSLRDMSIEQLEDVYSMYKMVLTRVQNANKSMVDEKREAISELASKVVAEVRKVGGEHTHRAAILDPARKFVWDNQKPIYAMEHIGSGTMTDAFMDLIDGEGTYARDVDHAANFVDEQKKVHKYDSWDFKKKHTFESASGLKFDLTLEQILSLYAYSKRDQAAEHLRLGGFVFDSNIEIDAFTKDGKKLKKFDPRKLLNYVLKYRVNTADSHQITPDIMAEIIGTLSANQRGFVDAMQDYLSTTMGAKGNEVTMKMYGVKLFKEKFYFPLKSAKQFLFEQNEVAGEVRIKNSGFTNKVVAKANNPVILSNFMDVWANHVHDMSMYHSFVLPLEDFNRIFNYNSPKQEGLPPVSVKGTIQNAYSPAAVNYVKQLITDLNGGARSDPRESTAKALMGRFKKAAVFASNSVVIQQPSALLRAQALVNPKYFGINPKLISMKKLWNEAKQYAPVVIIKEMGHFDMDTSRSTVDYIKGDQTVMGKVDDFLGKAPAVADEWAWAQIWHAVKRETAAKRKDLNVGSKEFLQAAGKRFTEVIVKTQVYDSTLSRSANMRSKSALMSMATAFMAEPTTSINMLEDGLRAWKRGYKKTALRNFYGVYSSLLVNAVLVSIVYAMRDDDEDETYLEKLAGSITTELLDGVNPLTYYPWLKDGWSLFQGFDVERSDMSILNDVFDALNTFGALVFTDTDAMDAEELAEHQQSMKDNAWTMVDSVASLLGVPVKNIRRDLNSYINTYKTFTSGTHDDWDSILREVVESAKNAIPVLGWTEDDSKTDKLYDALISGDETYLNRLKSGYEDDDAYHSAVRKALKENDERIRNAAVAWNADDLDEYMKLAKTVIADGFLQDDVVKAITSLADELQPDDGEGSGASKAKGLFTAEKFAAAIAQGDQAMAKTIKTDLIQTAQKNGKTAAEAEKNFNSSVKTSMKELLMDGEISESEATHALVSYCGVEQEAAEKCVSEWAFEGEYGFSYDDKATAYKNGDISAYELKSILIEVGGKTEEEADNQIEAYNWQIEVPDADPDSITAAAVRNYDEHCAADNVPKDVYLHIRSFSNNTKNDVDANGETIYYSAMKKVMAEINAQTELTPAQKTAVARSLGWAEKNIQKYKLW